MRIPLGTKEPSVSLSLSVQHVPSLNVSAVAGPGGVQWMTAGRGIIHAEMPVHEPGKPDPVGFQLWIDLPKQVRVYFLLIL